MVKDLETLQCAKYFSPLKQWESPESDKDIGRFLLMSLGFTIFGDLNKIGSTGPQAVAPLGGLALLEEVSHGGWALRFQTLKPGLV